MFPPEFLGRLQSQPYIDAASLAGALEEPAVASVRVNRFKWPHLVEGHEVVEWEPDGYYLQERPVYTSDPLFHAGVYYPQESSSMFAGEMFRQFTAGMSGLRVLDLCGAPGGKSTHLAGLVGADGLLIANEVIRPRAAVLAENITKWGTGNTIVTNADPSRFALLPGFFDVILTDAPCSGEGMFRSAPAVKEWSVQNTRLCSERQRRIVMDAWPSLRPGGLLIYSTCTFNPAENEENVDWLRDHTGAESMIVDLPQGTPVVRVNYGGIEGYGFYPGRVRGDGFFIAALRKPVEEGMKGRSPDTGKMIRRGRSHKVMGSRQAHELSESLVDFNRERVVVREGRVIALAADPDLFVYLSDLLPVVKSGTLVGEIKNDKLVPAHDLAMSVRLRHEAWHRHAISGEEALAYLRLESPDPAGMPPGRVLLTYRGVPLGFANNLGSRVNNGYPQGWRIRMDRGVTLTGIL